ncbi:hypothetical protein LEP1GSC005_1411 [Leptospira santarosai str. ST188]|nr:hypothetical protein LEP1GSC005_1411 [Leptospira santarosai str. ST188]
MFLASYQTFEELHLLVLLSKENLLYPNLDFFANRIRQCIFFQLPFFIFSNFLIYNLHYFEYLMVEKYHQTHLKEDFKIW